VGVGAGASVVPSALAPHRAVMKLLIVVLMLVSLVAVTTSGPAPTPTFAPQRNFFEEIAFRFQELTRPKPPSLLMKLKMLKS